MRMGPESNESVLIRDNQRHTETQRRRQCEDGIRVWSDMSRSQEMPRIAGSQETDMGQFFLQGLQKEPTLLAS